MRPSHPQHTHRTELDRGGYVLLPVQTRDLASSIPKSAAGIGAAGCPKDMLFERHDVCQTLLLTCRSCPKRLSALASCVVMPSNSCVRPLCYPGQTKPRVAWQQSNREPQVSGTGCRWVQSGGGEGKVGGFQGPLTKNACPCRTSVVRQTRPTRPVESACCFPVHVIQPKQAQLPNERAGCCRTQHGHCPPPPLGHHTTPTFPRPALACYRGLEIPATPRALLLRCQTAGVRETNLSAPTTAQGLGKWGLRHAKRRVSSRLTPATIHNQCCNQSSNPVGKDCESHNIYLDTHARYSQPHTAKQSPRPSSSLDVCHLQGRPHEAPVAPTAPTSTPRTSVIILHHHCLCHRLSLVGTACNTPIR